MNRQTLSSSDADLIGADVLLAKLRHHPPRNSADGFCFLIGRLLGSNWRRRGAMGSSY